MVWDVPGSILQNFIIMGRIAPKSTEMKTMATKLVVIANVSVKGVIKMAARAAPATPRSSESAKPIWISRSRIPFKFWSLTAPVARPRITPVKRLKSQFWVLPVVRHPSDANANLPRTDTGLVSGVPSSTDEHCKKSYNYQVLLQKLFVATYNKGWHRLQY